MFELERTTFQSKLNRSMQRGPRNCFIKRGLPTLQKSTRTSYNRSYVRRLIISNFKSELGRVGGGDAIGFSYFHTSQHSFMRCRSRSQSNSSDV